jgi:uncharacterized protein YbcI
LAVQIDVVVWEGAKVGVHAFVGPLPLSAHRWSPLGEESETEVGMSIFEPGAADQRLAAISASMAGLVREHYGRDSIKVKAYALEDMIVVVIRGRGVPPLEKAMIDGGEPQRVVTLRADFDNIMADRYKQVINKATGRNVIALLSQSHVDPDITVETAFLDGRMRLLVAVEPPPVYRKAELLGPPTKG